MFLITARFRPSRSKDNRNKPGVVFYRITDQRTARGCAKPDRNINSDIHGADKSILQSERPKIVSQLRLLYCVIERRASLNRTFTIDDVTQDFRKALSGDISMTEVISRAETDFPLRKDIVSVGREFKGAFKYVFTKRASENNDSLFDYIFNLSQSLKNEQRISRARSFISLLSNLRDFTDNKDINFVDIGPEFIHEYAGWLKYTGIAESTQSFYLRAMRSVLNKANKEGLLGPSSAWFRDVNTKIYHSTEGATDKALNRDLLLKMENADLTSHAPLMLVRDMFMFGFYCGGMELVDVANLTENNITDGFLVYHRRMKGLIKKIPLGEQALKILNRYKTDNSRHLFPLLDKSGEVMFGTVRNYVFQCMRSIGKLIGFPRLTFSMNINTYHSMLSGINISEIILKH